MKLISRENIDTKKWDERIKTSTIENIFQYSWYLDQCAENWSAIVEGDYETILPIPFTKKLGIKRFYQAPFTREYEIIGDGYSWQNALELIKNEFAHLSFRTSTSAILKTETNRLHQYLYMTGDFEKDFKTNAKRLIKKGQKNYQFVQGDEPALLIELFETHVAHKIDSIKSNDLKTLSSLMKTAINRGQGELIFARDSEENIIAGGFFLKDKKRITYLKGASEENAKKTGVMYALFDFAFQRFAQNFNTFDFGGSDIENVATFYRKFGASDRNYYHYELDQTPIWFKTLKKLKK